MHLGWRFAVDRERVSASPEALKVPRSGGLRAMRRALSELTARGAHADHQSAQAAEDAAEHQDGSRPPTAADSRADSFDARR
jgi:hypothetical protein